MSDCRFFQESIVQTPGRRPIGQRMAGKPLEHHLRWCVHPASQIDSRELAPEHGPKLECGGCLNNCEIPPAKF